MERSVTTLRGWVSWAARGKTWCCVHWKALAWPNHLGRQIFIYFNSRETVQAILKNTKGHVWVRVLCQWQERGHLAKYDSKGMKQRIWRQRPDTILRLPQVFWLSLLFSLPIRWQMQLFHSKSDLLILNFNPLPMKERSVCDWQKSLPTSELQAFGGGEALSYQR